jgi:hypothetical protein
LFHVECRYIEVKSPELVFGFGFIGQGGNLMEDELSLQSIEKAASQPDANVQISQNVRYNLLTSWHASRITHLEIKRTLAGGSVGSDFSVPSFTT